LRIPDTNEKPPSFRGLFRVFGVGVSSRSSPAGTRGRDRPLKRRKPRFWARQ